jgi:hypothetical protein
VNLPQYTRIDTTLNRLNSPPFLQHRKRTPQDETEPGIITDLNLLNKMLYPKENSQDWLRRLKEENIQDADLIDRVPIYPLDSSLAEIAESLLFHYGAIIDEGKGNYGIVTRNDHAKLLK